MTRITIAAAIFILALTCPESYATTYWVATNGSDANPGSSNAPFATPHKAVTATLAPGDTIYIRGGTYALSSRISPGSSKVGAAGNPIRFWAYEGELPIFDFDTMPESSDKGLDIRRNYWHVKGIEVMNAPDSGIFVGGLGVIIEGCVIHDCDNDGLVLGSTSVRATNALILNCDSYRNFQVISSGDNGDGFAGKAGCGPGNVFRGCRAWNNSDDGWDFYENDNSVVILNCWAFSNGYDLWGVGGGFNGNGNGFKLGGLGTQAKHYLTNCVAFRNRSKGFDHNHSQAGQTIVNCTSYSNNVNFSFYETPTVGSPLPNLLINNVAFTGTPTNLDPTTVQITNSWQGFTVTAADFASINTASATNARNADYSLPVLPMFRLAAGSDLIDRGLSLIGLPFSGSAPDLGAYEFFAPVSPSLILLSSPRWTNEVFVLQANGLTGHGEIVFHASTDLLSWSPVFTNPAATGSLLFIDTSAAASPYRFYRAEEK